MLSMCVLILNSLFCATGSVHALGQCRQAEFPFSRALTVPPFLEFQSFSYLKMLEILPHSGCLVPQILHAALPQLALHESKDLLLYSMPILCPFLIYLNILNCVLLRSLQ